MTDKIVNIFNKQPIASTETEEVSSIEEVYKDLLEVKDSVKEIITIVVDKDDNMITRSSNISRESAYFLLSLARNDALYG